MKNVCLLFFALILFSLNAQELKYRDVNYYFDQVAKLEIEQLLEQGVLLDSSTISEQYIDKESGRLNEDGFLRYADIKMHVYRSFFKDYLYQQHLEYGENVYVLYFTVGGFDDLEWNIVKWEEANWLNEDKLSFERLESDSTLQKLFWNYDEGPKNIENIKLFIENDFLVFERGNLYHSLYDLKTETLILNEESPWTAANSGDKDVINQWIKTNLHDKIELKLKTVRD